MRFAGAGKLIAASTARSYVDEAPQPGAGSGITTPSSGDLVGNVGAACVPADGSEPLRLSLRDA